MKIFINYLGITAVVFFLSISNPIHAQENLGISGSTNKAQNRLVNPEMNKVEITITVDWGRKSKDCEGFGICGIVIDIDIPMDTFFSFKKDGRRSLELFFQKEKHKEIVKYFGGERIILEEGYTLDLKTSQKLGFEKAYTIEKGEYPIVYDAKQGFYKITL